jgi:hypothetical protein
VQHEVTGLITPTLDPHALAETVLRALSEPKLTAKLRANARAYAEKKLGMPDYIARYRAHIETVTGKSMTPPKPLPAAKSGASGKGEKAVPKAKSGKQSAPAKMPKAPRPRI